MDDDLIAYLEKKIKALEAERDHWKSNHDNQVAIMQAISQRPDLQDRAARVTWLVAEIERLKAELKSFDVSHDGESQLSFFIQRAKEFEEKASRFRVLIDKSEERSRSLESDIESLKKQIAAAPHWVPVAEFKSDSREHIVWNADDQEVFVALMYEGRLLDVTHVLFGLSPPVSNEDPRGDGDLLPESERLDKLTRECMRDEFNKMIETTRKMDEPQEDPIRERLLQPFLGSEAEKLGATKYQLRDGELWECKERDEERWLPFLFAGKPAWVASLQYRLAKGE